MKNLSEKECVPCRGGAPPLAAAEIERLLPEIPDWKVIGNHHLSRNYQFPDFRAALDFVNRVGDIAETEGHHPDISFGWGRAELTILTHAIDGLTESDFILAAKIDRL